MSRLTLGRRSLGLAAAGAAFLLLGPAMAQDAEDFPSKTIEVVTHASYGGGTDVTARMMSLRTRRELDTDVVIVPKRGGSGAEAQNYVLSQPADGHTILALTQSHLYTMARGKSDMKIDDIIGVVRAMDEPTFITVAANSEYETLEDLIEASKEQPLNWGVAVIGGTEHIGLAQFAKAAGIQFKVVPFGGGGQMVQALLSGAIDATLPNVSESAAQVQDGSLRALAVLHPKRLKDYPDVPTSFEQGYEVKLSTTRGYAVRADTPMPIVEKLSAAMVQAMNHEVYANYLASAGLSPEDSVAGWEEWDKQLKEEYRVSEEILREMDLLDQ